MKSRLKSLLRRWAECQTASIRGVKLPGADQFVWKTDEFGNFHHGSYRKGKFVVLRPGFELIRGTKKETNTDIEEFGCAFRKLEETDQGQVIIGEIGERDEWAEYLKATELSMQLAERRLKQAWLLLIIECRKRKLV